MAMEIAMMMVEVVCLRVHPLEVEEGVNVRCGVAIQQLPLLHLLAPEEENLVLRNGIHLLFRTTVRFIPGDHGQNLQYVDGEEYLRPMK